MAEPMEKWRKYVPRAGQTFKAYETNGAQLVPSRDGIERVALPGDYIVEFAEDEEYNIISRESFERLFAEAAADGVQSDQVSEAEVAGPAGTVADDAGDDSAT